MSHKSPANDPSPTESNDVAKSRSCLRCSSMFESAWIGERICTRCKNSNSWRRGRPVQSHPTRATRR